MKKPLKESLVTKMKEHNLSTEQLVQLQATIAKQKPSEKTFTAGRLRLTAMLASVFAIALLIGILMPFDDKKVPESMLQQIANEVVKNHLHLKPLEVHTNNLDGLIHYFTQLDFLLRPSREVSAFKENLLGGRYCSLKGITAAQLRLINPDSQQTDTLYQTEYRKNIFGDMPDIDKGQSPRIAWSRGVKVKVWVEKGLLFAMTDISAANKK
ncbi:MAG: hypothetical protein OEY52_16895 [Gammaproteobacteria bacterium]|nr:hypothetical protein [Gammaproteobacteria bacterium]